VLNIGFGSEGLPRRSAVVAMSLKNKYNRERWSDARTDTGKRDEEREVDVRSDRVVTRSGMGKRGGTMTV
jgi:hypothetical protein